MAVKHDGVARSTRPNPTFVVYIDESGDEGFKFDDENHSTRWFVLAAAITRKVHDHAVVQLVRDVRSGLRKPTDFHLHFRKLDHQPRLYYIDKVAQAQLRVAAVLIDKRAIASPETFRAESRLYFYAARHLLERVSWFCRDSRTAHGTGDGSAKVVFSNRSNLSYDDLRKYMAVLQQKSNAGDVRIDWSVIRPETAGICALQAASCAGLQVADAIASSFFYAVEPSGLGFTESRYAQMLKPVAYNHQGKYVGYGVKFWPRDTESLLDSDQRFGWVRDTYR